jgi:hypothetical protein
VTEARHFERIRDAPARLVRQVLQVGMHVVMGEERCILLAQQPTNALLEPGALGSRRLDRSARPCPRNRRIMPAEIYAETFGCGHGHASIIDANSRPCSVQSFAARCRPR